MSCLAFLINVVAIAMMTKLVVKVVPINFGKTDCFKDIIPYSMFL